MDPDGNSSRTTGLAAVPGLPDDRLHRWQASIVREYAREDQFVTTCISYERPTVEDDALTRALDVTAGTPTTGCRTPSRCRTPTRPPQYWTSSGAWTIVATGDRCTARRGAVWSPRRTRRRWLLVDERAAYEGQWRQAAWRWCPWCVDDRVLALAHAPLRGRDLLGWVLPHSQQPAARTRRSPASVRSSARGGPGRRAPAARRRRPAVLERVEVGAERAPPPSGRTGARPPLVADRVRRLRRGVFDGGLQANTVHPSQVFDRDPASFAREVRFLVAAAFTIARRAAAVARRVRRGRRDLVVGIRTGTRTTRPARVERKPAFLEPPRACTTTSSAISGTASGDRRKPQPTPRLRGADRCTATRWADGARGRRRRPAATTTRTTAASPPSRTRAHGAGRVTYRQVRTGVAAAVVDGRSRRGTGRPRGGRRPTRSRSRAR